MKIEFEITDISRDEVIDAMARQLIGQFADATDYETGPYREYRETKLGAAMKQYLDKKIEGLAETLVREKFDEVIEARIVATVDEVISEGWQVTNEYGEARGPRVDLKGRITELMLKKTRDSYGNNQAMSAIDRQVTKAVEETLAKDLKAEITEATKSLRAQLETAVNGKFTEAIKAAMGVRS